MPRNGVAGRGRKGQDLCLPGSSENRGPGAPGLLALAGPGGSGGQRGRPGPPGEAGRDLKPPRSLLADRPLWGQFTAQRGPRFTSGSSQFPGPSVPMEPPVRRLQPLPARESDHQGCGSPRAAARAAAGARGELANSAPRWPPSPLRPQAAFPGPASGWTLGRGRPPSLVRPACAAEAGCPAECPCARREPLSPGHSCSGAVSLCVSAKGGGLEVLEAPPKGI